MCRTKGCPHDTRRNAAHANEDDDSKVVFSFFFFFLVFFCCCCLLVGLCLVVSNDPKNKNNNNKKNLQIEPLNAQGNERSLQFRDQLFSQNRVWADSIKKINPKYFQVLSQQQSPKYLWIGCSDSRVPVRFFFLF